MQFSQSVWKSVQPTFKAIISHPFIKELEQGTLLPAIFSYYIEQDALYLNDYARALALIAGRLRNPAHISAFLKFSQGAMIAEQEVVHQYFRNALPHDETGYISPACLSYTSFLMRQCAIEPLECAIAAVLPCFWVYKEVGQHIVKTAIMPNTYEKWIETYSGDEFNTSVTQAIALMDIYAEEAPPALRTKMANAFERSIMLEWHFWDDAYHRRRLDHFLAAPAEGRLCA